MKKLATTFGLLALMLIVTSFTTPSEIGGTQGAPRDPIGTGGSGIATTYEIGGTQGAPRDPIGTSGSGLVQKLEIGGTQGAPRDPIGNTSTPTN